MGGSNGLKTSLWLLGIGFIRRTLYNIEGHGGAQYLLDLAGAALGFTFCSGWAG
jgi:hypothetical protein